MFEALAGKAAGLLAGGVVGAAAYDGIKRIARSGAVHSAAVTITSWGLRGARAAEVGAERTRLATADIMSEARERIGEQAPAPGVADAAGGDEHEH